MEWQKEKAKDLQLAFFVSFTTIIIAFFVVVIE